MNYDLPLLDKLIANYDGDFSSLFPFMRERIIEHVKRTRLPDGFEDMLMNFMFFEYDYFIIKRDMLLNQIEAPVYDIGAQLGYQSELFLDHGYVGIENEKDVMFNEEHPNVSYICDVFPSSKTDVKDKVVISNMSLSFFNHTISDEKSNDEIEEILLSALSGAKVLYFKGTPEFTAKLKEQFTFHEELDAEENINVIFSESTRKKDSETLKTLIKARKHTVSDGLWKFWN